MKGLTLRRSMMVTLAVAWFLSYADRVNMSVASIPMQEKFGWDETTKGIVMGSVFLGYLCSQLLGGWIVDRVSAVKMIGYSAILFSLTTLATPYAAQVSFSVLIAARVLLGVAEGFMVPATYAFIGRWSPDNEVDGLCLSGLAANLLQPGTRNLTCRFRIIRSTAMDSHVDNAIRSLRIL